MVDRGSTGDEQAREASQARAADLARGGTDDALLRECRWEAFRASGPGGQKRNKTSSAIRITHVPTGISTIANESRKQSENRARALERLRHRMTIILRKQVDLSAFAVPDWFVRLATEKGRFRIVYRRGVELAALGLILDVLAAVVWSVSDAARLLGISTSSLTGALSEDSAAWAEINRRRGDMGMRALKS